MKKNLFLITEEEKDRILGMHKTASKRHYLSEAGPFEDTELPTDNTATGTPTTPTATTPTQEKLGALNGQVVQGPAGDPYQYKGEAGKYYYALKKDGTNAKWTEQTRPAGIKAIQDKILSLAKPVAAAPEEKMSVASVQGTEVTPSSQQNLATTNQQTPGTQTPAPTTAGGGGTPEIKLGAVGEAQKLMPNLKSLDPMKQVEVANWAKTPSGQYILNTPQAQREAALDNLDRRRGDQLTRNLKKEIRQALGMSADTLAGKVGSAITGGLQGIKQGFQQQATR